MKRLLLLTLFILSGQFASAYPITPRPLRKLIVESKFIVQAFVLDILEEKTSGRKKNKSNQLFDRTYAKLLIRQLWQGNIISDTIKVFYEPGLICPAPPQFDKGAEIIAFLDPKSDSDKDYEVHALSYGVKIMYQHEFITTYKLRIKEMQEIIKIADPKQRVQETQQWLVSCAENPITRWEGVYELMPQSHFMSLYDRSENTESFRITVDEKQRLFKALLNTNPPGYTDLGLIDLCMGIDDHKILQILAKCFDGIGKDSYWLASSYMQKVVDITRDKQLELIMKEYNKLDIYNGKNNNEDLEKLIKRFKEKMIDVKIEKPVIASGENLT